jgi:ComF family protein
MAGAVPSLLRKGGQVALDFLFPPLCIQCRQHVGDAGSLCAKCWSAISFIEGPICATCGLPFDAPVFEESRCAACYADPPSFDRARAVMRYDDASKESILAFKHGDRIELVPSFARWMARTGRDLIVETDLIVAVPLHRTRLWSRRYNQAAELARSVAHHSRTRFEPVLIERVRHTPSQGDMPSASARRRNVAGAFRLAPGTVEQVKGRTILVIDDVLTTGATVDACAQILKRGGAKAVYVLALARVVRPSSL